MNALRHGMTVTVNAQAGQTRDPMSAPIGLNVIATGIARGTALPDGFARHSIGLLM